MQTFQYKDFDGSAEIDTETLGCRGKILFIDDLVTYKANSVADLLKEFHAAVDDYLETCAEVGKAPQKPCKGQFNVRVTSELHRQAQRRANEEETSLNAVVASALKNYLHASVLQEPLAKVSSSLVTTNSGSETIFITPNQHMRDYKIGKRASEDLIESVSSSQTRQFNLTGEQYSHVH